MTGWRLAAGARLVCRVDGAELVQAGEPARRRPLDFRLRAALEAALAGGGDDVPLGELVAERWAERVPDEGAVAAASAGGAAADAAVLPPPLRAVAEAVARRALVERAVAGEHRHPIEGALARGSWLDATAGGERRPGAPVTVVADDGVVALALAALGREVVVAGSDPFVAARDCAQAAAAGWRLDVRAGEPAGGAGPLVVARPMTLALLARLHPVLESGPPPLVQLVVPARSSSALESALVERGWTPSRRARDAVVCREEVTGRALPVDLWVVVPGPRRAGAVPRVARHRSRATALLGGVRLGVSLETLLDALLAAAASGAEPTVGGVRGPDFELVLARLGDHTLEAYLDLVSATLELAIVPAAPDRLAALLGRLRPHVASATLVAMAPGAPEGVDA